MRTIIFQIVLFAAFGGLWSGACEAKPVIIGNSIYMDTVYHDCDPVAAMRTCTLKFAKVPAGKILIIQRFSCNISSSGIQEAYLLVNAAGIVGVQIAIPMAINGPVPGAHLSTNQQLFAASESGYPPSFVTIWATDPADGDMTCTIAGYLQNAP